MRPISAVPATLLETAARQEGLVSARQCEQGGLSAGRRAALVAHGRWARVTRGVFDVDPCATELLPHDARRRRAAWTGLLAFGPGAVAVGKCALALHGVAGLPATVRPEAAVQRGRDRQDRDGIRLREFDDGMETIALGEYRLASVTWAVAQAVPELARGNAVAVMDSAQNKGLVDAAGIRRAHGLARGRRGVARTHEWWSLSDGRAESPLETFARLDCVDVNVPPDELQVPIVDEWGGFVARGDLGWELEPGRWLIAEIDGREWHDLPTALLHDRRRQNAMQQAGVAAVLRFTAEDLRIPGRVGSTVRTHLHRRRRT